MDGQPQLARGKSVFSAPLTVLGVGHGGIDRLREHVNDGTVQWGLLRFQVGGGNFQRTKFISICINGEDCPAATRGRLASRSKDVMKALGTVHAGVDVTRGKDLTVDFLIARLLPIFVSDNMDATRLKQMYNESVMATGEKSPKRADRGALVILDAPPEMMQSPLPEREAPEAPEASGAGEAEEEVKGEEETAPEVAAPGESEAQGGNRPKFSSQQALDMVSAPDAPLNWFLFEPERFEVHSAGSGGVEEMHSALDDGLVLFGVVRFVFKYMKESSVVGFETHVNTAKYYFVHWMGEATPPVKKSKWNRQKEKAQAFARTKCAIAISKTANTVDDLDLRAMISDLYRFTAVDSECQDEESSVDAYLAAIAEEQQERERKLLEKMALEEEERQAALAARRAREAERRAEEEAARPPAKEAPAAVVPEAEKARGAEPADDDDDDDDELPSATSAIIEVRNACGMWDWVLLAPMKFG